MSEKCQKIWGIGEMWQERKIMLAYVADFWRNIYHLWTCL